MTTEKASKDPHPSGDDRYKAVDRTMKRFDFEKDALLEVLNTAQETFGYLSPEAIKEIARQLKLSESEIFGVATFYAQFRFTRPGDHNIRVCLGTACHVRGGAQIMETLERELDVQAGGTTKDY